MAYQAIDAFLLAGDSNPHTTTPQITGTHPQGRQARGEGVKGSNKVQMAARLANFRNVVLMLKDLPSAVHFYGKEGLGLTLKRRSEMTAEFDTGGPPLVLKAVEGEAMRSTGYSPFLCFDVMDMDSTVVRLLGLGASLDGPIKYPAYGKVGMVRSPDGHMIGLFEPGDASASSIATEVEEGNRPPPPPPSSSTSSQA